MMFVAQPFKARLQTHSKKMNSAHIKWQNLMSGMESSLVVTNYKLTSFDQSGENIQRYGGCSERHHSHHIKRDGRGIITKLQPGHPKEREKNLTNDTSGSVNSSSPACTPVRRYVISENKISNCKCIRSSRHIITSCYMPHHDTS